MTVIAIINYGMGSALCLRKRLQELGVQSTETTDPEVIRQATGIILPSIGVFDCAMEALSRQNLTRVIKREALMGKPLLGIHLGMHLLFTSGDENGYHQGLNLLSGHVVPFAGKIHSIHMGWSKLRFTQMDPLTWGLREEEVYFAHDYQVEMPNREDVIAVTDGDPPVVAMVVRNNICGMQFRVEKSGPVGLQLLRRFVDKCRMEVRV